MGNAPPAKPAPKPAPKDDAFAQQYRRRPKPVNPSPQPRPECKSNETEMRKVEFKLHVAIDFGTDGCALAFAYKGGVSTYHKFKGHQIRSNERAALKRKTKTQLILNAQNEVTCFGNSAKFTYCELTENARNDVKFFERFKMRLYERHLVREQPDDEKIDTAEYLTAINGARVKSEIVFIAAFRELQKLAKSHIRKLVKNETIEEDEIQWIVTVPAIWSQKAKNKMKTWITKAGLVSPTILNQCMIVYEPDCASLSISKQFQKRVSKRLSKQSQGIRINACNPTDEFEMINDFASKESDGFEADDLYMLIDAGGGTVDIACHKIRQDGCVEEMVHPTGNKWGSCYLDDLFIVLLGDIFSKEWIREYKAEDPAGFIEIVDYFQTAKERFYSKKGQDEEEDQKEEPHGVLLPNKFMEFLDEKCATSNPPELMIKNYGKNKSLDDFERLFSESTNNENAEHHGNYVFRLKRTSDEEQNSDSDSDSDEADFSEYLEMDHKIWKCLFDSKIDPIIAHVRGLFNTESMKYCKYIGLVGGFACSLYFQKRIKDAFGIFSDHEHPKKIIIPKKPMLAVVEGAAWMAVTQYYIRARKMPKTYGIRIAVSKNRAQSLGMSQQFIHRHTEQDGFIDGHFHVLAMKGERIEINQTRKTIGYRRSKTSSIPILESEMLHPITHEDGHELARLRVPSFGSNKKIITEFHFYNAMFEVYSYPENTPNAKQSAILQFPA
eukprot:27766_1